MLRSLDFVVTTDVMGQPVLDYLTLKMDPLSSQETLVTTYQFTLHNIPVEQISYVNHKYDENNHLN